MQTEVLVSVSRGGRVESEHRGAIVAVNVRGEIIASIGDPDLPCFLRSIAKPFQLLPLVESGAADRFGFSNQELAIMAGSHSGEETHVETVRGILKKMNMSESALQCGAHEAFTAASQKSVLANNCSGKHAGMLAWAVDGGHATDDYVSPKHLLQKEILKIISEISGVPLSSIGPGIDGCSAPTYQIPLRHAARLYAVLAGSALVNDVIKNPSFPTLRSLMGDGFTYNRAGALSRIGRAMMEFPAMVAGPGRFDTDVMTTAPKGIISKGGAEGVQAFGVLEAAVPLKGVEPPIGIAIKIADGNGKRGHAASLEALNQLGVLRRDPLKQLKTRYAGTYKNHRGIDVGEAKADFQLKWRG